MKEIFDKEIGKIILYGSVFAAIFTKLSNIESSVALMHQDIEYIKTGQIKIPQAYKNNDNNKISFDLSKFIDDRKKIALTNEQ